MEIAVLIASWDEIAIARKISESLDNCAVFVRKADGSAPADAWIARRLLIIGGGSVGHPHETIFPKIVKTY